MAQKLDFWKLPVSQKEGWQEQRNGVTCLIYTWLALYQTHIPALGEIGHSKQFSCSENLLMPSPPFLTILFPCIQYCLWIFIAYPIHTWKITLKMLLTLGVKSSDCQQICRLAISLISKDCGALSHSDYDPLELSKPVAELLHS